MIDLDRSYRGGLIAMAIVIAVAWLATPAEAHEAVTVGVDNANGVLQEVCAQLAVNVMTIEGTDRDAAKEFYDACIEYTAEQMYAQPYPHDHS